MAQKKRLVVIDGKSVFYRGYYAMPNLATVEGKPTGGVYGFAVMALRVLKDLHPDYVIVAWDKAKTNIRARRKMYAEYKANRKPMPEDMREQIPHLRELLDGFGWPLLEIDDYEADDIMGTLAVKAKAQGLETVLVTSDLDVLQLVDTDIKICTLKQGLTNIKMYTEATIEEEFGFSKEQFDDYKGLKGDSSDNIPGVAGVGEKTAKELILKYGNLEAIYNHLNELKPAVRAKLEKNKDMAFLSRELVHIMCDAPVELDLGAADTTAANPAKIKAVFKDLNFKRLQAELPKQMQQAANPSLFDEPAPANSEEAAIALQVPKLTPIHSKNQLDQLKLGNKTVLYTLTDQDESTQLPRARAVIISPTKDRAYILEDPKLCQELQSELAATTLIGYNLKRDLKALYPLPTKALFDVMIAAFVLNSLLRTPSLEDLAQNELGFNGTFELSSNADQTTQTLVAVIWELYERYQAQLNKVAELKKVAHELDFALIPGLARMECRGIKLDTVYLKGMSERFGKRIKAIEELVHKEAGQNFNISSPQQLQLILFDKLQLPRVGIKKTKTGYSTGADELVKLRALHPIIDLITEYRELTKLKSTYVDSLPKLVDSNNRLHTTFNQTIAQTGRLSSENPNLQNIPVRTEVGKEIRRTFVAEEGNVLISADYSQFELRLAAVLSNDKNMIHAFNKGIDIHTMTAAELYDIPVDEVSKPQRYSAKTVNFGVLYGMSPHGLSVATGMSREEAQGFITRYFGVRQDLLKYLDNLKKQAKEQGYVETLFGRRRPMPDIHSSNFVVRGAAERAAMNMPIQGTEADLMKLAMIKIDEQLDEDCWMLLQIHDSILVECPTTKASGVADLLKDIMENVYKLPVKLDVDVSIGQHWGEL